MPKLSCLEGQTTVTHRLCTPALVGPLPGDGICLFCCFSIPVAIFLHTALAALCADRLLLALFGPHFGALMTIFPLDGAMYLQAFGIHGGAFVSPFKTAPAFCPAQRGKHGWIWAS